MRWGVVERSGDALEHTIKIIEHLIIPEANNAIATSPKLHAATIVRFCTARMLAPIELNDELRLRAGKIDDALADGMLSPKLPRRKALAQRVPQDALDVGSSTAETPCQ